MVFLPPPPPPPQAVVTTHFKRKWHKFMEQFPETFVLFMRPTKPGPDEDFCWRIRLVHGAEGWVCHRGRQSQKEERDRERAQGP